MTWLLSPAHLSLRFVPRRRFPWNIILLSIFVSGLGLVGGRAGAPMAPQLPRRAGSDRGMHGQAGGSQELLPPMMSLAPMSPPFSPTDAGHGADDGDDRQVCPGGPAVTGAGVPPVPRCMAGSNERLPGAGGHPAPLGSGTVGSLPRIGAMGGHQRPRGRGMPKCGVTLVSPPSTACTGPTLS